MNRNRIVTGIIIVLGMVILGYTGYQNFLAPLPESPTDQVQTDDSAGSPSIISAEGRVVPEKYLRLSFNSGGVLGKVYVSEGEVVQEGQKLARLHSFSQFEAAVSAAELQLISAQQTHDSLYDGLDLTRALALKAVLDGRDAVDDLGRLLDTLQAPADQTDIDQARANLVLAKNRLKKTQEKFAPYENKPEDNLVRAALLSALAQAQSEYDAALRLVNNLEGSASELDIARVEADLGVAQASLAEAEKDYEALGGGPDPDDLELAAAQLANAGAQLAAALDALGQQELVAPFAGTIVRLDLKVAEFALPGIPVIVLADLSAWRIETTDLSENDVALLSVDQAVVISIDAFGGRSFTGTVLQIGLLGEDSRGAVTYTVVILIDPGNAPVRWGMSAFVDIKVE